MTPARDLPEGFSIREAERNDAALILEWVRKLAGFEGLENSVSANAEGIERDFFDRKIAHALFVETGKRVAGFAVWYYNYSSFAGKQGLFLEDIFIDEQFRAHGLASGIFAYLERRAKTEGCSRLEWYVLDWNQKALRFYRARGGSRHEGWQIYRKYLS